MCSHHLRMCAMGFLWLHSIRAASVDSIGLIRVREGPWFRYLYRQGVVCKTRYKVFTWGNLLAGAKISYYKDKNRQNRAVQLSVRAGIAKSRRYDHLMPDDACTFLVEIGNVTNSLVTNPGILDLLMATPECEKSWTAQKAEHKWRGLEPNVHDAKKLMCVHALNRTHTKFWKEYQSYEVSNTTFKEMNRVPIGVIF